LGTISVKVAALEGGHHRRRHRLDGRIAHQQDPRRSQPLTLGAGLSRGAVAEEHAPTVEAEGLAQGGAPFVAGEVLAVRQQFLVDLDLVGHHSSLPGCRKDSVTARRCSIGCCRRGRPLPYRPPAA
jgi:hypothetical protein